MAQLRPTQTFKERKASKLDQRKTAYGNNWKTDLFKAPLADPCCKLSCYFLLFKHTGRTVALTPVCCILSNKIVALRLSGEFP